MNDSLSALLSVQKIDAKIRTFKERIDKLSKQRAQIEQTLTDEQETFKKKQKEYEDLHKASQERSSEVDDLDAQIRQYQKKLDDGLLSFKEMEAFREKIDSNRAKMERLEEEAIELLNQAEVEVEKMKEREASFKQWQGRIEEEIREVDEEIAQNEQKISAEQTKRQELLSKVDPVYFEKYNLLLKIVENPIAPIRDGMCSGCKVILSNTTLERARMADSLVTCENCMRLIYI